MRQTGPHRTYLSDFILWTWTLPQVTSALGLVLLVRFHTGQALVAMVVLFPKFHISFVPVGYFKL